MSQDLFAAFGEAPESNPQASIVGVDGKDTTAPVNLGSKVEALPDNTGLTTQQPVALLEDDDDFGDFEDAAASDVTQGASNQVDRKPATTSPTTLFPPKAQPKQETPAVESKIGRHPFADHMDFLFSGGDDEYDAGADDLEDLSKNPEAAMAYSKRMIAEQEARAKTKAFPISVSKAPMSSIPSRTPNKLQKKSGYVPQKDPHVLFDADDVSASDDDFGEFEEPPQSVMEDLPRPKPQSAKLQKKSRPPSQQQINNSKPRMPVIDLLGLGDEITPGNVMSPRSERVTAILGGAKLDTEARPSVAGTLTTFGTSQDEDAWDDFEAAEPKLAQPLPPSHSHSLSPVSTTSTSHGKAQTQGELPPTNIPPPVVLLSVFPAIFSSAQEILFGPLSKLDHSQRQQLLSHPATHQFLRTYLNHAVVLAHIIAGRKLRWKRDQILAQSMRIGPSAAGGKGGMKLASIDKSEIGKEDREVLDSVQRWRLQVGKLRGAVATASTTTAGEAVAKFPAVPEIAETMPVKGLKVTEGGFTAPHACALCGLKREERVAKVDVDIDDSFGEWWVDSMNMHVACRQWWDENKAKLRSR
jgi:hypothetical protein